MRTIDNETQLHTRLLQMTELLEQERNAIVSANTDLLETIATKKLRLTNILADVSPELLHSLSDSTDKNVSEVRDEIKKLIEKSSLDNSINGNMLTQARNMTEKSIGLLLSYTERNPVEIYDEQGKVPDPAKKRELGAA